MSKSRLSLAVESGLVMLPDEGMIGVYRPGTQVDLHFLPKTRVDVIHSGFAEHQFFEDLGYTTRVKDNAPYAAAVVFLPRSKALARETIHQALIATDGGPVIIDGQKTDGVDSVLKSCRSGGGVVSGMYSKFHGKLFSLSGGDFSHWAAPNPEKTSDGYYTSAGVFSADGIDPGSALLVATTLDSLNGTIADLGAGWGYISDNVLANTDVRECHLIEADHAALDCAKLNISDPRARFHWADATNFTGRAGFDHIVMNPPFHTGRTADPDLGRAFISASARLIRPPGTVWLVANRHLPYERHLSATFKEVVVVASDNSFKVFRAKRPVQPNT